MLLYNRVQILNSKWWKVYINQMKAFLVTSVLVFSGTVLIGPHFFYFYHCRFSFSLLKPQFFSSVKPLQYLSRKVQGLVLYKAALSPQTRSKADLRTADSCIVCKVFPWMLNVEKSLKNECNVLFIVLNYSFLCNYFTSFSFFLSVCLSV